MGNYANTNARIVELREIIAQQNELIQDASETIAECRNDIGECEGFLEELAQMDGYRSYNEYCDSCMHYEEPAI